MRKKIFIILIFILIFLIIKCLSGDKFVISMENFKNYQRYIDSFVQQNYFLSILLFILMYIFVSVLPLPGDSALAIISGYLFGVFCGLIFSLIAVTTAAILMFFACRYFIKNNNHKYNKINIFLILALRLLPILPVSIVNVMAALSSISFFNFTWTTLIGMIPILYFYVNIGNKMHQFMR